MPSLNSRRPVIVVRIVVVALLLVVVVSLVLLYRRNHTVAVPREASAEAPTNAASAQTKSEPASAVAPSTTAVFDYHAALDKARALSNPRERSIEFGQYFQRWMDADVGAALAYLQSLPRTAPEFTQGLTIAVTALAASDPEYALRIANQLVTTREQQAAYNALFALWAQRDPAIAAQRIEQVPLARRDHALRALAETWAAADFAAAWRWAQALPVDQRAVAIESALSPLAASDPKRAMTLAHQTLSGPALERTLTNGFEHLMATDLSSAAAEVPLLPPGDVQTTAAAAVARAMAASGPADALRWAEALTDAPRTAAAQAALQSWAASDPHAAGQYVLGLVADAQQPAALAIAGELGEKDPPAAIAWAETLASGAARAAVLAQVADGWARHDPAAAAQWVASQGDALANLAPSTLNAALSCWVLRDPAAMQNFIGTLPPTYLTSAAGFAAPLLAQHDPVNAMAWAESLPDAAARDAAAAAAYRRWLENAPREAQTWLSGAALAPDVKARLRNASPGR